MIIVYICVLRNFYKKYSVDWVDICTSIARSSCYVCLYPAPTTKSSRTITLCTPLWLWSLGSLSRMDPVLGSFYLHVRLVLQSRPLVDVLVDRSGPR